MVSQSRSCGFPKFIWIVSLLCQKRCSGLLELTSHGMYSPYCWLEEEKPPVNRFPEGSFLNEQDPTSICCANSDLGTELRLWNHNTTVRLHTR